MDQAGNAEKAARCSSDRRTHSLAGPSPSSARPQVQPNTTDDARLPGNNKLQPRHFEAPRTTSSILLQLDHWSSVDLSSSCLLQQLSRLVHPVLPAPQLFQARQRVVPVRILQLAAVRLAGKAKLHQTGVTAKTRHATHLGVLEIQLAQLRELRENRDVARRHALQREFAQPLHAPKQRQVSDCVQLQALEVVHLRQESQRGML